MAEKLPWTIKQQCLWIVRDYDRARREYIRARRDIIDAGGDRAITYEAEGEERRAYMPQSRSARRTTEDKQLQLEALERTQMVKQIRAVEHARANIGEGLPAILQDALRDAVMLNCMSGRRYPFERLYVVGVSRSEFYRTRDAFFREIAEEVGII